MRKIGVDVSRYNGRPNWATAKANGVQFAILRAVSGANGVYVDPTFEYNYAECKKAGVPVGLYVASYLNVEKEIAVTSQLLKGKKFEYPIYYDIEDFSFTGRSKNRQSATNAVVRFCKHFERLGYYVGIYSNKYFIDQWLDKSQIKDFDIWIADWRKGVDYSKSFGMHQFTNRGRFTGIQSTGEGGVDANYAFIDYPNIIKKAGLNGFKKNVQKAEVKGVSKLGLTKEQKDSVKNTVVTYLDEEYQKAYIIAQEHKALLAPAPFNFDFGRMVKSGDTIIAVGGTHLGKIEGKNYGLTGYATYHVKSTDKAEDFNKDRTKFLVRKK